MIKLIVGLGNPGLQYERTRHNAGFLFLDGLVSDIGAHWSVSESFQAEIANVVVDGHKLMLLKPMTFMNRSGLSVGKLMRYFKFECEQLLVVHDELDLPSGAVRLKCGGGHAGHNGIRDIIAHVGSKDFYRLRIGIGRPLHGLSTADYVLSAFSGQDLEEVVGLFRSTSIHSQNLLGGDVAAFNGRISS